MNDTASKNFKKIKDAALSEWEAFNNSKTPRVLIGTATCGRAAGAAALREAFAAELKASSLKADIGDTGCFGMCYAEPLVEIWHTDGRRVLYGNVNEKTAGELVRDFLVKGDPRPDLALGSTGSVAVDGIPAIAEHPMIREQVRVVLRNAGIIDPTNLKHYIARGGYSGLVKALSGSPENVIGEIKKSGLRGRGGAGFPTGKKWEFARKSPGDEKYVVCNADEGDPGAFMDRSVLESDPHSVLEGLAMAAYAVGSDRGIIYVRAEYPLAVERLKGAIDQMREHGLAGKNVLGSGFNFDVSIKEGAGAFVCGEETALIASIEGRRGMPRSKPPFPVASGIHKKPTVINNVETLANVSGIMEKGPDWFLNYGTKESPGTKTFALAGKIKRTGLIEVPMGIKIGSIINDIGDGTPGGEKFKAVQTGGPSGGCIPYELADLRVDFEELTKAGSIMGSGAMIVLDKDSCMVDIARYFLEFTNNESCGKCTPCRVGSQHLLRMLNVITEGEASPGDLEKLEALAETVKSGSLCGLGQTLPNPVLSTLRYFRNEYNDHIERKRCEALACKKLVSSPCKCICPINQDVPCYIGHIARGEFTEAIDMVRRENPFPGICGRVCPHPCEGRCEAAKYGKPISIRSLKRFAADYEVRSGSVPKKAKVMYKEKVAIIGAGPAGLSAGYFLTMAGYSCTVFEKLPVAGGMLAVGIPDYRLPKKILEREIDYIAKTGVEIKTNMELGKDFTIEKLFNDGYTAVFIAIGAHKSLDLGIKGEDCPEVIPGVKFLRELNLGKKMSIGKRVAVIGGGDAAIDSARTALRLGSDKVFLVYRRSRAEMPASEEEIEQMEDEGIKVEYLAAPVKVARENGKFKGIECVRMRLGEPDSSGRRRPVPVEGSEFLIQCDNVISAIGQSPDSGCINDDISITKWNTVEIDSEVLTTSKRGVFAGGDAVTGPADVITAIAHGKRAAISIAQFLKGQEVVREYGVIKPVAKVPLTELTEKEVESLARPEMPCGDCVERTKTFTEVEQGFDEEMAVLEAKRCLRCDHE